MTKINYTSTPVGVTIEELLVDMKEAAVFGLKVENFVYFADEVDTVIDKMEELFEDKGFPEDFQIVEFIDGVPTSIVGVVTYTEVDDESDCDCCDCGCESGDEDFEEDGEVNPFGDYLFTFRTHPDKLQEYLDMEALTFEEISKAESILYYGSLVEVGAGEEKVLLVQWKNEDGSTGKTIFSLEDTLEGIKDQHWELVELNKEVASAEIAKILFGGGLV